MDILGSFFDTEFPELEIDKRGDDGDEEEQYNSNRDYYAALGEKYRTKESGASIEALVTQVRRLNPTANGKPNLKQNLDVTLLKVTKQQRGTASNGASANAMVLRPKANVWFGMPLEPSQKKGGANATAVTATAGAANTTEKNGQKESEIPDYILGAYIVLFALDRTREAIIKQLIKSDQKPTDEATGKLHPKLDVVPVVLEKADISASSKAKYFKDVKLGNVPPHKLNKPPRNPNKATIYQGEESREIKPDIPTEDDLLNRDVRRYLTDRKTANLVVYLIWRYKKETSLVQSKPYQTGQSLFISAPASEEIEESSIITLNGVTSSVLIKACYVQFGPAPSFDPVEEDLVVNVEARSCDNTNKKLSTRAFLAIAKHTGYFVTWMDPVTEIAKQKPNLNLEEARKRYESPSQNDVFLRHNILISDTDHLKRSLETAETDCIMTLLPSSGDPFWSKKELTGTKESQQQIDVSLHGFQWKQKPVVCENPSEQLDKRFYRCYSSRLGLISGLIDSGCEDLKAWGIMAKDEASWTNLAPRFIEYLRAGCSAFIRYFASEKELDIALKAYVKMKESMDLATSDFIRDHTIVEGDGTECLRVSRAELPFAEDLILKHAVPVACYQIRAKRWFFDYSSLIRTVGIRIPVSHAELILNKNKKKNLIVTLPSKTYSDNNNVIIISDDTKDEKERKTLLQEWAEKGYEIYLVDPNQKIQTLRNLRRFTSKEINVLFDKTFRGAKDNNARLQILKENDLENSDIINFVEVVKLLDGYIWAVNPRALEIANKEIQSFRSTLEGFANSNNAIGNKEQTNEVVSPLAGTAAVATSSSSSSPPPPSGNEQPPDVYSANNKASGDFNPNSMQIDKGEEEEEEKSEKKVQDEERMSEKEDVDDVPIPSSRGKKLKRKAAITEGDDYSNDGYHNSFVDEASQNPDSLVESRDNDEDERSADEQPSKKSKVSKKSGNKRPKRN